MAIVNVTPDSFYATSRTMEADVIRSRVLQVISEGADIIDIGGYSTRPARAEVSEADELERLLRGVEIVRTEAPNMPVSLDTFRANTAKEVMRQFGACIINDVSAGEYDPAILDVAAEYDVPYIAMHNRGVDGQMHDNKAYGNIVSEVCDYLQGRAEAALRAGIKQVILDPGFGFAKTVEGNYELLAGMGRIKAMGYPLLVGISRKSMIYKVLGVEPDETLTGTVALHWECLRLGANILRVHDVRATMDVVKIFKFYKANEGDD